MSTCIICGWPTEVKYVPSVIVSELQMSGKSVLNVYVSNSFVPSKNQTVVSKGEARRVTCRCDDSPRHP